MVRIICYHLFIKGEERIHAHTHSLSHVKHLPKYIFKTINITWFPPRRVTLYLENKGKKEFSLYSFHIFKIVNHVKICPNQNQTNIEN